MRAGQIFMQLTLMYVVIVVYSIIVDGVERKCLSHAVVCNVTGVDCLYLHQEIKIYDDSIYDTILIYDAQVKYVSPFTRKQYEMSVMFTNYRI